MAGSATASYTRPVAARIVLVLVLVGFVALAVRVAMTLEQPPSAIEQKLATAERYLYYRIAPGTGPVFELTGTETTIRLVTHAVVPMPPGAAYDPARELEYGVRLALERGGGAAAWTRDVFTRARQSKARRVAERGGTWLDENTFSLEPGLEVTDDRLFVVSLPADVPPGATLRVTLLGDAAEGYLRAYTPIPRPDAGRKARELSPADRGKLAERISYLPWDRLPTAEDLAMLRFAERRLSAEGKDGTDYQTRTLYTTEFRLRYATVLERGMLAQPGHAVAVNVVGPARLELAIARPLAAVTPPGPLAARGSGAPAAGAPSGALATGAPAGTLVVKLVGEGQLPPPRTFPLPARDVRVTHLIEVPAGTFTLTAEASAPAQLELTGPPNRAAVLGGLPGAPLVPDEQIVPVYLAQPAGPPVTVAVEGPPDLLGRVIRVDVRTLASTPVLDTAARSIKQFPASEGAPAAGAGSAGSAASAGSAGSAPSLPAAPPAPGPRVIVANLTLEAVDAAGRVVATSTTPIESEVSAFETARFFGKLVAGVCEPINVRFVVPPAGREVRLRTDRPALLTVSTPVSISPPQDRLDTPYDAVPLATMLWRYARYLERGWLTVRPRNHDALMPERVAELATQARLEPREVPPAPEVNGVALSPAGRLERQTVVERIAPEDTAGFVARWAEGHYTRLPAGRAVQLDLSRVPSRPTLQYWATGAETDVVGASAKLAIDGRAIGDQVFTAAQGAIRLPAGLSGVRTLQVDTAAPVRMLIDRPPARAAAGELHALRSVFRIDTGRSVRVTVTKRATAPQNVNIVVYARAQAAEPGAAVRVVIDGGSPARIAGTALARWTLADRTLPLPPADRPATLGFANVAGGGVLYPRLLVIALGDDLPAGVHTVDLSVTGAAGVWGRFFTLENAPIAPRALQWRDATDTSEGSP